jgi:hypothetical protein
MELRMPIVRLLFLAGLSVEVVDDTGYCFFVCASVLRMCLVEVKEAMGQ